MSKETDLSKIESSIKLTADEYSNIPLATDCTKLQALQILTKEISLVSNEKKRIFEEELSKSRFELEKDHKYWTEKFEEKKNDLENKTNESKLELESKKFESEKDINQKRLDLESKKLKLDKNNNAERIALESKKIENDQYFNEKRLELESKKNEDELELERLKIQIESARLDIEKTNLKLTEEQSKKNRIFQYVSLGLTVGIPALTYLIGLAVYKKLAYANLKLIYVDEGRPTPNFNDAVKNVNNFIKK